MKTRSFKIFSVLVSLFLLVTAAFVPSSAASEKENQIRSEISKLQQQQKEQQAEINRLKNDASKQQQLKTAIEKKMALVQQEIDACNRQINAVNAKIAANKAEIDQKNAEIEKTKLAFKKRLRAIYMSNTNSSVQVLLGADDFAQFLELSQLTASVAAKDKKMIEEIVAAVKLLEEKQAENNKLLEEQMTVKNSITQKQQELKAQSNEIQAIISQIKSDQKEAQNDKNATDAALAEKEKELAPFIKNATNTNNVYDGGPFLWPTTVTKISSSWGSRWGRLHAGVDISNGTYGNPIFAIADGTVERVVNSCPHNYPKQSSCGCGGGYGRYVLLDNGKGSDGVIYKSLYGHMSSAVVSAGQHVTRGQIIGYMGCTGHSTGPHLHFEIWTNGTKGNPMRFYTKVN